MSKQKGFTLIELIVVIVILGILAATALPKFVDLSSDARFGVMRGVEAAMRGANTMLYGKAAANNQLSGTGSVTVTIGGVATSVTTTNGYAQDAAELAKVLDLNPAADFNVTTNDVRHARATVPANCAVTYGFSGTAPLYTPPASSADCS